jgi:serine protease Do
MAAHSKGKIMLKQKRNLILAFIISFGMMMVASTAIATSSGTDASTPPYPIITSQTYINLYNKVIDSVVTVIVEVEGEGQRKFINNLPPDSPFNQLFKDDDGKAPTMPRAVGKGSGYIVSEGGLVYTNHHVVFGAQEEQPNMRIVEIVIVWHDQKYRKATVVASDPVADVAILQIIKEGDETFQALKFADSDLATPGTMVAAIGTPLDHPFSITSGIISGVGRPTGKGVWVKMLQTDTVINKGNSGGPLFNIKGEVIGMNTLIMSPSGFFIGIGYAIPSNTIIEVASQLIDHGEYIRPWIGVSLSNLSDDFKSKFNVTNDAVVFINVKPDGPAGKSGFRSYDIILEWDGETIDAEQLITLISESKPGDTYTLLVRRIKDFDKNLYEDVTVTLTIGVMPVTGK